MCFETMMVDTILVCSYVYLGILVVTRVYSFKIGTGKEVKPPLPTTELVYLNGTYGKLINHELAGISISADDYELPCQWRSFCKLNVSDDFYRPKNTPYARLVSIVCNVSIEHSGVWKMEDLRENLKKHNSSNKGFSVVLQCQTMSNISLSLPFNVYNLIHLEVTNCAITDYFEVFRNKSSFEETPDSIRVLQLIDCVILTGNPSAGSLKDNPDDFCIHQTTIESISFRNIKLLEFNNSLILSILKERRDNRRPKTCRYLHLKTFDRSKTAGLLFNLIDVFIVHNGLFTDLMTYNMSYNQIEFLNIYYVQLGDVILDSHHAEWQRIFPHIETIDLSHNKFATLDKILLQNIFRGKIQINLQYNKISTLTVSDLEVLKEIYPRTFIDLRNNFMDCNCSSPLRELLSYIENGKLVNTSYAYIGDLQCQGPASVAGNPLKSYKITTYDVVCKHVPQTVVQTEYFRVPILILSAVIIILSILIFIVFKFRQEITIILFTRCNIVVPCHTRENNDAGKIYDAFVSYSSSEDDFVENFFEDLENTTDFKFCMHHRDFIPGKTIFDNVTRSIESSRHTVILLSNHFIESEFCLYEFQEAFRQSIMEKRRHLVIVMLEDIPDTKLPRDLRRCMNTFTYIRKDDFLFKKRLIYALSVKHTDRTVKKLPKSNEDRNVEKRV